MEHGCFGEEGNLFWLFAVAAVIGVHIASALWKRRRFLRVGNEKMIERLVNDLSTPRRVLSSVFFIMALVLIIFALARPRDEGDVIPMKTHGIDVVFALDVSKSMLAQDIRPSRLTRAKVELASIIEGLKGNRFGIVVFAGLAFPQCPMTTDVAAAKLFLRGVDSNSVPVGGTSLSRALQASMELLEGAKQKTKKDNVETVKNSQAIVLLSDGEGHNEDPLVEAKQAAEKGIVIYTVGIGTESGSPIPEYYSNGKWAGWKKKNGREIMTTMNTKTLQKIARAANGRFFELHQQKTDIKQLFAVLHKLTKTERTGRFEIQWRERYLWFLFPAFLLLLLSAVLGDKFYSSKGAR